MHESCHHCDYDLGGLPSKGRCPECGEAYDKHSYYRTYQATEPAFVRHFKWVALGLLTLMVLMCGGMLSVQADRPWGAIALTLIIASLPAFGSFTYWWVARQEKRQSD